MKGDVLKKITNKTYNVDLASLSDRKLMYGFGRDSNFDLKGIVSETNRDRTLIKLPISPGLMVSASGVSKKHVFYLILMNYVIG